MGAGGDVADVVGEGVAVGVGAVDGGAEGGTGEEVSAGTAPLQLAASIRTMTVMRIVLGSLKDRKKIFINPPYNDFSVEFR
jgi:hypothetical protein